MQADHPARDSDSAADASKLWLTSNAIGVAIAGSVAALLLPSLVLSVVAAVFHWHLSPDPRVWIAWAGALAACSGTLLTAGYFVITSALFRMAAWQAQAAARQAQSAADAARQSAEDSKMSSLALSGTLEQQRIDRLRLWEPIRLAIDRLIEQLRLTVETISGDSSGATVGRTITGFEWWGADIARHWEAAESLLPTRRQELAAAAHALKHLSASVNHYRSVEAQPDAAATALKEIKTLCGDVAIQLRALADNLPHTE